MDKQTEKYIIHQEIFKREPELQENYFIVQRIKETCVFLKKTLKGIPEDEETENFFYSLIKNCEIEYDRQTAIIGSYITTMIFNDMNETK